MLKKKDRLECEQATLDDDTCTALDCFAAEQYKQKASLDECSAGLLERVAQLPQGQRLVINEVFLKGKSQREVATALGITSQSVYCSKKAALDALRRAYGLGTSGLH